METTDDSAALDEAVADAYRRALAGEITLEEAEAARGAADEARRFAAAQREWAAAGVPVVPVRVDAAGKRPAVRGWQRVGLDGSAALAERFAEADGLGFAAERAGITVVDVDEPGDEPLRRALDRFGQTPAVVRTASGKAHCYYRRTGEGRLIRPYGPETAIDVIGEGLVVAPPTRTPAGSYGWLRGGVEALADLPPAENLDLDSAARADTWYARDGRIPVGRRNSELWRLAMREAPMCDDLADLEDVVRTASDHHAAEPLPEWEIRKIAASAWSYEERGENWIGRGRSTAATLEADIIARLAPLAMDPRAGHAMRLYVILAAQWYRPGQVFAVSALALAPVLGVEKDSVRKARDLLVREGLLEVVEPPRRRRAGRYRLVRSAPPNAPQSA